MTPHLSSAADVIARAEDDLDQPLTAMIELSDRCNEVCVHCYQVQGQKGEMNTEQVYGLLDDLARAGVLVLTLSGGEVMLRRDFFEIAAHARGRGFLLRVFTNGLLIDEAAARRFAELAVQTVEISVYSPVAETHDFVTGVPGSHERTLAGIQALVGHGVPVVIKTPVMSVNAHQMDAYHAFAERLGVQLRIAPGDLSPREGGTGEPWDLNAEDEVNLQLSRRYHRHMRAPTEPRDPNSRSCGAGRDLLVEANGQLRPCTLLEVDLGDLTKAGVRRVRAESSTLHGLLRLRWQDLHGCRDCDLAAYCGRCFARALAETGDALGPHRSACKQARTTFHSLTGRALCVVNAEASDGLGPYRMISEDSCQVIPDNVTAADEALAGTLGWARRPRSTLPTVGLPAQPGQLVQLRRPGQKRAMEQRVPLGLGTARDSEPPDG